ncbi:MAG: hypothetical protein E7391_08765 [Ruminococcaceae bacterium]|nr:hypothetical protein [Oscillospiraceae bacterium]
MSETKNIVDGNIIKKLIKYLFFFACIGVFCGGLIVKTIKELPIIDSFNIILLIVFLCIELMLCIKLCILLYAIKSKSYVNAIIQEIKEEKCDGDEAGSYYYAYRVFVKYTYKKENYKNVFWYALDNEKTSIIKVMERLPQKGRSYKLLINPLNPSKILSGKPSKED